MIGLTFSENSRSGLSVILVLCLVPLNWLGNKQWLLFWRPWKHKLGITYKIEIEFMTASPCQSYSSLLSISVTTSSVWSTFPFMRSISFHISSWFYWKRSMVLQQLSRVRYGYREVNLLVVGKRWDGFFIYGKMNAMLGFLYFDMKGKWNVIFRNTGTPWLGQVEYQKEDKYLSLISGTP